MKKQELPFRIEKRESFCVVGYSIQTTNKRGEAKKAIPSQWSEFKKNDRQDSLMSLAKEEPYGLFGISVYNTDESDPRIFKYFIAVSSNAGAHDEFDSYTVPAMTWAVFPCTIETIGKTEVQAITKWLPKSKYKPLNKGYITGKMKSRAPDIQYYGKDDLVEVWVAVEEK